MNRQFIVTMAASCGLLEKAESEAEAERKAKLELSRIHPDIPLECLSSDLFHWEIFPANKAIPYEKH